jgi:hypothetical protein
MRRPTTANCSCGHTPLTDNHTGLHQPREPLPHSGGRDSHGVAQLGNTEGRIATQQFHNRLIGAMQHRQLA